MGPWIKSVAGKCAGVGDFVAIITAILAALSSIGAACPIPLPPLGGMDGETKLFWLARGALNAGYRLRDVNTQTVITAMQSEPISADEEKAFRATFISD